ncbi:hypothetical protein EIP91_005529 [Steccherinum ochraceum]|uniref:Transcription factor n=1 Tax=Steccherinum ochraceum TaxID=92696 RepID=A0A4R0RME9_9APHY|nr:hypothetical protein EIP91_005529 [Steccherinum ochraceum]
MAANVVSDSHDALAPPHTANPQALSRSGSPPDAPQLPLTSNQTPSHPRPPSAAPTNKPQLTPVTASSTMGQQPTWTVSNGSPGSRDAVSVVSTVSAIFQRSNKRKLDASDIDEAVAKIRKVVSDHVSQDPARVRPMTTVLCLHAAVAQKSYGNEKRFLCPPPVVHVEGPVWNMKNQQLSMAVVSEGGERSPDQKAPFDQNLTASFKFLHVTGTAKTKSFQLSLDIAEPPATSTDETGGPAQGRVWAQFDSAPVTIISKPSKKTAKTRNISSCILAGGPVSLFNRINSQTVRTKYMTVDKTQLCASNVSWSAFNVNVVRPHGDAPPIAGPQPQPVTYGSEIVLSDTGSGTQTAPLIIRKVDKGRIAPDDGGPVSQMQKIALQRVNPDGTRHYLSAAGPMPGTPGAAPVATPGVAPPGSHPLLFQAPRVREEVKDGARVITDEVDDYLCWTIVGISKFQYTFFDAFGQNDTVPTIPITPFPTLFTAPAYRPANNTIELTVANFFYAEPKTGIQTPLDVYVGNLGPLQHRLYQATPHGPLTSISSFVQSVSLAETAPNEVHHVGNVPPVNPVAPLGSRYQPPGPIHTIVVVEMPQIEDMIKALEEDPAPPDSDASDKSRGSPNGDSSPSKTDTQAIAGRSLPLLFIRPSDGVGYHSGRAIACENVFQTMDLAGMGSGNPGAGNIDTGWLAAAQAAAAAEGGLHGWTLRVI